MGPLKNQVVTRGGPIYTAGQMAEMTEHALSSVVELPARMWNAAMAITGQADVGHRRLVYRRRGRVLDDGRP